MNNFTKYFSGTTVYEIVNNCLIFAICYLRVRKKWFLQNFARQRNGCCCKSSIRMLKFWHCQIIMYLFAGFKTMILCSIHSLWFVKYVRSAKIWSVKTSTRIVKYESRVVKNQTILLSLNWTNNNNIKSRRKESYPPLCFFDGWLIFSLFLYFR